MLTILYVTSYLRNKNNPQPTTSHHHQQSTEEFAKVSFHWDFLSFILGTLRRFIMSLEEKFEAAVKVIRSLPPDGIFLLYLSFILCKKHLDFVCHLSFLMANKTQDTTRTKFLL